MRRLREDGRVVKKKVRIQLSTVQRLVFEGEGGSVVVPGADGEIGIFPDHAALIGAIGIGEVRVANPDGWKRFFAAGGYVRVLNNEVILLADEAIGAAELDVGEAEDRLAEARRLPVKTDEEYAAAQEARRYAEARLRVARRGRA